MEPLNLILFLTTATTKLIINHLSFCKEFSAYDWFKL